ncbi:MAG: HAD family hydrolase [Clostridia bacterium]|nr:HAD family hydrolase [Clostridia bacterium]
MKKKFDGVLFDLDGTLWDASSVTAQTWVEVLARHLDVKATVELNRESVCRYMGLTNEELAGIFFPALSFQEAFSLMEESCALENLWLPERGGILYPGVPETLALLKEAGYRLFVVSNAQDGYIESFLTAHRLWDVFEDRESSGRSGKNKAENIRDVMNRRGVERGVYVGDTVSDAEGAHGAGIPFVYCLYGFGETWGRGKTDDYEYAVSRFADLPQILEQD